MPRMSEAEVEAERVARLAAVEKAFTESLTDEERRERELVVIRKRTTYERGEQLKRDRARFAQRALNLEELYREGCMRVQYIKTRYKASYSIAEYEYTIYNRIKNCLSKFEYNQRKAQEQEDIMVTGNYDMPNKEVSEADKKYLGYMKNMLYYSYGIGMLYNEYMDGPKSV